MKDSRYSGVLGRVGFLKAHFSQRGGSLNLPHCMKVQLKKMFPINNKFKYNHHEV